MVMVFTKFQLIKMILRELVLPVRISLYFPHICYIYVEMTSHYITNLFLGFLALNFLQYQYIQGADQLISTFVIRLLEGIISRLATSKFSIF